MPVVAILSGMGIQAYLDRIGHHGPLAPTAETLRALQVALLGSDTERMAVLSELFGVVV